MLSYIWHSSVGWAFAHGVRGLPFDSHQCLRRYVEEIGSAAMLAAKRSAGVAPEVNLRERVTLLVRLRQVRIRQNPLWLWNPEETSPEVQNRGISGPTKRTHVLQKILKKKKKKKKKKKHCLISGTCCLTSGKHCLISGTWCPISGSTASQLVVIASYWYILHHIWYYHFISDAYCLISGTYCTILLHIWGKLPHNNGGSTIFQTGTPPSKWATKPIIWPVFPEAL